MACRIFLKIFRSSRQKRARAQYGADQFCQDIYNASVKGHETFLKTDLIDFGVGDQGFIWEQDPVKRREVAKKLLPAFSTKAIKAKEPAVHKHVDMFVTKMKELGGTDKGVDINEVSAQVDCV